MTHAKLCIGTCKALRWHLQSFALLDAILLLCLNRQKKTVPIRYSIIVLICDPHGARTHDPNIKSVVLYQLS